MTMPRCRITAEAARDLYYATARDVPGEFLSTDQSEVEVYISDEVLERLNAYRREGESISGVIMRLCCLARLLG